jgi:dipeptide/tripeptide permease
VGELLVNPQGTALVAKIAPPKYRTFLLGVWLLSSSLGGMIIGQLARLLGALSHPTFFLLLGALPAAGALALLCLWKPLSGLLGEGAAPAADAEPIANRRPALRVVRGLRKAA